MQLKTEFGSGDFALHPTATPLPKSVPNSGDWTGISAGVGTMCADIKVSFTAAMRVLWPGEVTVD